MEAACRFNPIFYRKNLGWTGSTQILRQLLGWDGSTRFLKKEWISKSVLLEIGHVRIAERVNCQICCWGNGASPDISKSEFRSLFARKVDTLDFRKNWIFKPDGVGKGQCWISEHRIPTSDGAELGHFRVPEKWIDKSVGIERGHVFYIGSSLWASWRVYTEH